MSKPTRLLGALDNDVNIAVGKFLENGVSADIDSLYAAILRSNSSIKRKPKKVLQQSLERCLDFRGVPEDSSDSEADLEREVAARAPNTDLMNRRLEASQSSSCRRYYQKA
jgi:ribosome biogenesis ATPase